ncbi:MAG TPA: ABC transporter permease subunit [Gemmataceae bacterium]|jgi:ABC-type transport system involved in multi-copper enzyme maturation permease subunit
MYQTVLFCCFLFSLSFLGVLGALAVNRAGLSRTRAWCYLVWLSWQRQARAAQMVWIAVGLLLFVVSLEAIFTSMNAWSMRNWRWPYRQGPTFLQWADEIQILTSVPDGSAGGQGVQAAVAAAVRGIVHTSGFAIFSHWGVFLLFLSFLLPLFNLSFATEALGGERENNSLIWLLTRPLPRPAIYLAKFVALLPWTLGLSLGGFGLMCLAGGKIGWLAFRLYWPAVLAGTLAFSSLFYLMGAWFRRPAVAAIVYSFFLEVILGNMPGFLKRFSIGYYTRCMMFDAASSFGIHPERPEIFLPVEGTTALTVLLGLTIVLLGIGTVIFSRSQYQEII